ncbi:NirD/YgiW/YdeI family stress tolerance protein [Plesiomonas shigelloides]|uniref:YgiW/YdeI family stress tolerance OB fold protein n=1 Tax=Plesiomonas shigelloides TaxID=703 RepID=UPI0012622644|nr:NirD/YgiW/YdeI family stress tolerance protein [Plesiomonas shigelloides]KAB7685430.1 NirD/YgiW/YdeI family stress tolerance protein [Plesiomonas shigelloides]
MFRIFLILMISTFSATSFAAYQGNTSGNSGGFSGPTQGAITVAEVKKLSIFQDDQPVILIGKIVGALGGEYYTFQDNTGQITIEIDNDDWFGINVTPQDTVRIYGELDNDLTTSSKIDVKRVELLK